MSIEIPRTILHGVQESVESFAKLPDTGNLASECLAEDVLSKHVYDSDQRKWLPMEYISFYYDVAEHDGSEGTHDLDVTIPAGTILIGGILVIADKFVLLGGTPTVSIGFTGNATAILNALDVCAEDVNAMKDVVPLFADVATWKVPAVDSRMTVTISGESSLEAGRLYGYLMCFRNVIGGENSSSSISPSSDSSASSASSASSVSSPSSTSS